MFEVNEGKHNFYAIVGGVSIGILTILSMVIGIMHESIKAPSDFLSGLAYLFNVIIPILLVGELVILFAKPGERKFESKWWIVAGTIFYVIGVQYLSYFLNLITQIISGGEVTALFVVTDILFVAGFALLVIALLENKFWKLSSIGLGIVAGAKILTFFISEYSSIMDLIVVIPVALLLVIPLWKENKILRTIAVVFSIIGIFVNRFDALECLAYIVLAYLMVPAGKVKFDFYFIPGISFLLMAIGTLSGFNYTDGFAQTIVLLVFIAAPLLLSIAFFAKRFGKLAIIGYTLMFVCIIIGTFYDAGISAFSNLSESITVLAVVKAIALLLFGFILFNRDATKNGTRKIVLIVISIITVLATFGLEDFSYYYYDDEYYKVFEVQSVLNIFFAISMFVSALVLVPFKFTKYQSIGKHIFLSIFTFGVWHLIWVYNVTKNLDIVDKDKKLKYTKELLLYMFIPFYAVYWNYKVAYAIDKYAESNGVESKNGTMVFLLSLVSPLISSILIQSKFNAVEIR